MIHSGGMSGFWQYMGSFIGYTMLAIGFIYAVFFYLQKNPRALAFITQRPMARKNKHAEPALCIETALPLEARKTLYIIKSGQERFLIATSNEGTQFLSKLAENESPEVQTTESTANTKEKENAMTTELQEKQNEQQREKKPSVIAMHPILSPLFQQFKERFEKLQYQFEKTSASRWY